MQRQCTRATSTRKQCCSGEIIMSKFKGKNKYTKLSDQFIYKSMFFNEGHSNEGPEVFYFDFIEYQLYGAIDLSGSSIYPREQQLKNFKSQDNKPNNHRAFSFVVNMFEDVKINMRLAMVMGNAITDNENLLRLEVKRAYEPPKKIYSTFLANHLIGFNNKLESSFISINNITSFEHYVKEFLVFSQENLQNQPLTFSGFLQSGNNSLLSTGLALTVADIGFDDDDKKFDEFMSSNAFEYFKKVCLNRGFRINKHIPHMLVADLTSPAILPYLDQSLINTLNQSYNKAYILDYIILRKYIIDYYNILVLRNPNIDKLEICRNKVINKFSSRNTVSLNSLQNDFDDFFWINYYVDLRNIELGNIKGKSEIKKIKKYLKNLRNSLDNSELISYIDSNFRTETFKKSYGYHDTLRRRKQVNEEKDREEGITGGSTIGGGSSGGY